MISIITPTFNRGYIIDKAYKSLLEQTNHNFEWIVIDDGSIDDTENIISNFIKNTNEFKIIYQKQTNGGKHRALNNGVKIASGDYIFILDSDDFLTNDAVEKIYQWINTIKDSDGFAGVAGFRGWIKREGSIGNRINKEYIDATNLQRYRYKLLGDKAEVYKKELMIKYPFPEFEGEKFISESSVWDKIAEDGYKLRWFNDIIYKCEYLEDGLTKQGNYSRDEKNYLGFTYCTRQQIKLHPFLIKLQKIGYYRAVSKRLKKSDKEIKSNLEIGQVKFLSGILFFKLNNVRKKIKRKTI